MDRQEARDQIGLVRQATRDATRPVLPLAVRTAAALFAGVGVALLGQPSSSSLAHLLVRLLALALLAAAYVLPTAVRRRRGLFGFQGRTRSDHVVFLIVSVSLLITGLDADATTGAIYVGLGLVSAVTWFLVLSRRLSAGR